MPEKIIIADSSCLIAISNIEELELLKELYSYITITPEVQKEFGQPIPDWILTEEVQNKKIVELLELDLDKGEASAIALAIEHEPSLLIIDEKKGRRIAQKMGIKITGLLGIMIKAKESGIIPKVKPLIEKLEKVGFRVSEELKIQVLKLVDEFQ